MSALSFQVPKPYRKDDGLTYYFRIRIPKKFQPAFPGKREIKRSLKTRSYDEALERSHTVWP